MELFPLFGFIDVKNTLLIAHLFGVAVGAGGAFLSALFFMKVMYDGKVNALEISYLHLLSGVVLVGLCVLFLSGVGLFLLDPKTYLASTKFLSKMTIIAILIVNGTLIHSVHIPVLKKKINRDLTNDPSFKKRAVFMYAGGAVSLTSWMSALILGSLDSVPYSYGLIMLSYFVVVGVGIGCALLLKPFTFGGAR